jgi:hypothetical protein
LAKPRPSPKKPSRGRSAGPRAVRPDSGAAQRRKHRQPVDRWLLAILCLAALLRLWGIQDRLPDPTIGINVLEDSAVEETDRTTMGRAWAMWRGGEIPLDLNPHTGGWPALSFYATLATQGIYKVYYSATHPGASGSAFSDYVVGSYGARDLFLLARILGAILGVLTVALTYRLGALVGGRFLGIGAGLLLAVNVPHVLVSQHVSDPNLLGLLFVLLACFPMVRIARGSGTTRDSIVAGAMIGLAGASKYVPLVVGLPFLFAHPRGLRSRAFWLGVAAAAVALFIATPFTFLDWRTTLRDLDRQKASLFSSWVGQSDFPISLPTYLIASLPHAMGWPAYLLAIGGCVVLWRRGRGERILVGTAVVLIVVNGMLKAAQERYVLVVAPILAIAAAAGFERALGWWRARAGARFPGRTALAAPALVAALAAAWPLPALARIRSELSLPDTRHVARRWVQAHVPPDAPVALDLYGPVFAEPERVFLIWPFFATQAPLVRPAYRPEFLDGIRYYIQSSGISGRFEGDSAHYPAEVAFYRWLRERSSLLWSTRSEKASGPVIEVRAVPGGLSTRAVRDSLFEALMPRPYHTTRLALWCADMSALFGKLDQPDRAEEWARRGLRVDARNMNGQLQVALALALLRKGNPAGAEQAARAGVGLLPRSPSAHFYRGLALRELGRREEALPELNKALEISGDNRIRLNVAQILAELGRFEEAASQFEAVPHGVPERGMARRDLGVLYLNKLHRPAEGIAALEEAAALEPDPREAAMLRAEVARLTGGGSFSPRP